jgi:single-strand DNA-binding protein
MANITIHGNLGKDPELRAAGSSQVLSFSVADRAFISSKPGTEAPPQWYKVEVWGQQGERLYDHLSKGSEVVVSGQLIQRPYEGKNGPGVSMDLKASSVTFAGKKSDSGSSSGGYTSSEEVPF